MEQLLIGVSRNIQRIRALIDQIADTGLNTIIYGETGVGKELIVQCLYQKSDRVGKPFVKVNCAALPDTLLESEMFGYEQGAFTGAERRKRGKFEQAHSGVLFLDEIGDMSVPLQSKLLHVLQGGDFTPLGSEKSVTTDTWVIAATNHELEQDMQNGEFREDLYYRLSTIKIYIEPLRNRPEDIPHLIEHYIKEYTKMFGDKKLQLPGQRTITKMSAYHWPGNVRELQNMLKRIMILGEGEETIDDLLNTNAHHQRGPEFQAAGAKPSMPVDLWGLDGDKAPNLSSLSLKKVRKKALDRVEREVISYVLEKTGWNRSKATKILNISYKTLLYKIKDLDINSQQSES
ncbi:MAG: sigma-54-dependent Fis family transcriptional regulator, partial [Desulfobacterales bacterium]|nr:sigma-54-dependent Fis family transcriptional regulator [Desulfobacterales bacterium]